MKTLLSITFLILSFSTLAQNGFSGGNVGPRPTGDERVLLDVLRDRANNPLLNNSGNIPRPSNSSIGTNNRTRPINLGSHAVIFDQNEMDAISSTDFINNKRDEVLPTRLHIESINLSSDEVSEITLKDGSVVKVEDLQEFVREKMKEKLNQ